MSSSLGMQIHHIQLEVISKEIRTDEGILTSGELEESEKVIILVIQSEVFAAELKYLRNRGQQNRPIISENLI